MMLMKNTNLLCLYICKFHSVLFSQVKYFQWFWKFSTSFGTYDIIKKTEEFDCRPLHVPECINRPLYAKNLAQFIPKQPEIKTESQIQSMKDACKYAAEVLHYVGDVISVGMSTEELDRLVHAKIISQKAYPSPLLYKSFPKSICTSINNVACHGIPDRRLLVNGDIISVDVTVFFKGFHGDCCETFLLGDVDDKGYALVACACMCRDKAISICGPGVPFSKIGANVELVASVSKYSVIPEFAGHGIGSYFHGPPDIYHCYNDYPGEMLPGMTFTIEPVILQGSPKIVILEDGWTAVSLDNSRSAQFEHTILITENGHEILTL